MIKSPKNKINGFNATRPIFTAIHWANQLGYDCYIELDAEQLMHTINKARRNKSLTSVAGPVTVRLTPTPTT